MAHLALKLQIFLLPFEHLRIAKGNVMHKILCITWFTLYASVQTEAKMSVLLLKRVYHNKPLAFVKTRNGPGQNRPKVKSSGKQDKLYFNYFTVLQN